jgi:hypothetical protein
MRQQGREILTPSQPALEVNTGQATGRLYSHDSDPWADRGVIG